MENNKIEQFIKNYVEAVDSQNAELAGSLMHPAFRVVMRSNREEDKTTIISRELYLQLMSEKKVGGSKRSIDVHSLRNYYGFANASLALENDRMKMDSVFSIVSENGNLKIISDQVYITFK